MPKKRHKSEEIVAKLRQVDVPVPQGKSLVAAVCRIARPGSRPTANKRSLAV